MKHLYNFKLFEALDKGERPKDVRSIMRQGYAKYLFTIDGIEILVHLQIHHTLPQIQIDFSSKNKMGQFSSQMTHLGKPFEVLRNVLWCIDDYFSKLKDRNIDREISQLLISAPIEKGQKVSRRLKIYNLLLTKHLKKYDSVIIKSKTINTTDIAEHRMFYIKPIILKP